ncbi:MAG: ABC transporter substrate-binding protein [Neptuniibacter sp.]
MNPNVISLLCGVVFAGSVTAAAAESEKVLVVMSYEQDNPWCQEIKQGIDSVLADKTDLTYFYMDTKVDPANGPVKAAEALEVYQKLQPQGVIAIDDNAQSMFVVPSLKDQVGTPVMFAGVNSAADKYGYPNSHISGILERAHVHESLAFAKQLMPNIQSACFMTNDVSSGRALNKQVDTEMVDYPVKVHTFFRVKNAAEIDAVKSEMNAGCDVLFVDSLEGIKSPAGEPMDNRTVLSYLKSQYSKPILGGNRYQVEQGAWAAVVKTGQEQGETSAEMLLKAMQGVTVADIPVVKNTKGERIVNVTALDSHDVPLKPLALRGATLVRQK